MKLFKVQVLETRVYDVTYVVEADTAGEATEKTMSGDTVSESRDELREITNRDLWDEPTEVVTTEPKEHDLVTLAVDLPQFNLKAGTRGTIVHIYPKGGFEVEFLTAPLVVALTPDQVRKE